MRATHPRTEKKFYLFAGTSASFWTGASIEARSFLKLRFMSIETKKNLSGPYVKYKYSYLKVENHCLQPGTLFICFAISSRSNQGRTAMLLAESLVLRLSLVNRSSKRQKTPPEILQNCPNLRGSSALCHSIESFAMTCQKWDKHHWKEETEIFHLKRSPGLPKFAILFQFKFYQNLGKKLSQIVT